MSVKTSVFNFQKFSVIQNSAAMRITTDSVLLGSWASQFIGLRNAVLDVGTGTGIVSLIMAMRCPHAKFHAIDIEKGAAAEADLNFKSSPWSDRLSCEQTDFREYKAKNKFDVIVSNPPYFEPGCQTGSLIRQIARSYKTLSPQELMSAAAANLISSGQLVIIVPVSNLKSFSAAAEAVHLFPLKMLYISGRKGITPYAVLILFKKIMNKDAAPVQPEIAYGAVREEGDFYTRFYYEMTKDLYLWKNKQTA